MNRTRLIKIILLTAVVVLLTAALSHAVNVPQMINYNGTLTDTSGNPVPDGQYDVVFTVYDAMTNGNVLWTETWNASTTKVVTFKGSFNAMLGAHTTIPQSFFADNQVTYLGVKVGTDSEMLPRQRIMSVGYAFTAGNGIPKGGIIMWSGAVDQIPEGWALCDGTNGTPNLRDRFIVGAGSLYSVGATGGEATHALTIAELATHTHIQDAHTHTQDAHTHTQNAHSHTFPKGGSNPNAGGPYYAGDNDLASGSNTMDVATATNQNATATNQYNTATNQNTGGGAAHENRPPYYALAFIMKL